MYGLYRTDPNLIEMIAPTRAAASTMRTMFGPAWKARKLTAIEAADPWVQGEVEAMKAAGVWSA